MENKTKIILTRKSAWLNRLRPIRILIDRAEAGSISNGSSEEFVVDPGIHKIQCQLSWYQSREFDVDIKPDQIIYLKVRNAAKLYWPLYFLLLAAIFASFIYKGHQSDRPEWLLPAQILLMLPFILYVLYYISIGRKKYFAIEEDMDNVFAK
jgi:hypothetical protein